MHKQGQERAAERPAHMWVSFPRLSLHHPPLCFCCWRGWLANAGRPRRSYFAARNVEPNHNTTANTMELEPVSAADVRPTADELAATYKPGSIVRVRLRDFLTYANVEFRPGPR